MRIETRHSMVLVVGTGTTALLSLVYSVYAGRALGPADYAEFTAAVSLAMLACSALGPINGTVARFAAEYATRGQPGKIRTLTREITRRVALYGLIVVAVALVPLRLLADLLQFRSVSPLLAAYALIYVTLLLSVARGALRGVQRFGLYNVNIILEAIIRLALGVGLLALVRNAAAGLGAYVLATAAILPVSYAQLRGVWRGFPPESVDGGAVRRFTVPMFVIMFTVAGFQNLDMLFVKACFPDADAGLYGAAFILARSMSVLVTPFDTLLLPLLTALHGQGRSITGPFLRVCAYFLLLAAGPVILLAVWADAITLHLYGSAFAAAAPLLLPLTVIRLVAYLAYLLVLAGLSTARFGLLYVYVPGLAVQALALAVWHRSLHSVLGGLWLVHLASLASLLVFLLVRRLFPSPKPLFTPRGGY